MTRAALVLALALALAPPAGALTVRDGDGGALVVSVPGDAPREYALVTDHAVDVAWTPPGEEPRMLRVDRELAVTLAAGEHALEVTRAPAPGWLLVVPEDPTEPGAALEYARRDAARAWVEAHATLVLVLGSGAALAGALTIRIARARKTLHKR